MIKIPKIVYKKFLRFALENANPFDPRDWKECIGLVLGRITEHDILVTDIVPIGSGTAVFVDITDYEKVFSLISPSRIDHGEVIVGWAHTHPGLGLFLSGTDIRTQQMYQQMHPKAFALVMDPSKISPEFSGFNIYRLDEFGSNPTTINYSFDEQCDFFTIRETLTSELYVIPPVLKAPAMVSESEVLWKGIRIMISGDKEVSLSQPFQLKILVKLPFRQFIRVEYQTEADNITDNPFTQKLFYHKAFYHETITSGTLGVFTFRPTRIGTIQFRINNLLLADYKQSLQKIPDLNFQTQIQGE
ncbi:MAG: Mov34/MPN/PAD-1 family protein [Candidatus Hodarchaeales archaeon]|jgi:proteasome lid subunit RPN8/RPN11